MHQIVLKIIENVKLSLKDNFNGIELKELLLTMPFDDVVELICLDEKITKMIDYYNVFEQFVNYLKQIKYEQNDKIINSITQTDIDFSKGKLKNYSLTLEEMKLIFSSLERNLGIYEKLYMNKVYKLETTLNKTILLNIGKAKLFHLLGYNLIEMQREYRNQILKVVPEMKDVLSKNYVQMCIDNDISMLKCLFYILKREQDIICAVDSGVLSDKVFTSPKIKLKNFAFERLGLIQSPSGVIFYTSKESEKIKSDIFILRDFIRDYNLNWIFNGYAHKREVILSKTLSFKKEMAKNAETLLIEPDDSSRFDNQLVSVSTGVGSMNKSQFDFKVSTLSTEDDPSSIIPSNFLFEESDIRFMASKIISNFPNLNLQNLQNFIDNKLGRSK